jgi:hypothetical protein
VAASEGSSGKVLKSTEMRVEPGGSASRAM